MAGGAWHLLAPTRPLRTLVFERDVGEAWRELTGFGATRMKLQNLRAMTRASLLPVVAITLAAGIFVADTIADLEIAFPAFYTVVVLLAVRFCKKHGVILVGRGCCALPLPANRAVESSV